MNYSLRVIRGSLGGQIVTKSAGESPNADIPRAPDKGCELHRGRCLECPFPHCKGMNWRWGSHTMGKINIAGLISYTTINLNFWNGNPPDYGGVTMPRLPAISNSYTESRILWPFVMCLSPQSCRRLWGTDYPPEIQRADVVDFDPATEVGRAPESENHMKETR